MLFARAVLAATLIATGALKLLNEGHQSTLFSPWLLTVAGIVEVAVAVGLATRWWRQATLGVLVFLVVAAGVLMWRASSANAEAPRCGCLGTIDLPVSGYAALLGGMTLIALVTAGGPRTHPPR